MMETNRTTHECGSRTVGSERSCATQKEVEEALEALTDSEHAKLMLIAVSFCQRRNFSPSVMEPEELLADAMLSSLRLEKKWVKQVSIVKHLDRAMENISGHLARKRSKIVSFPDGLPPEPSETDADDVHKSPESALVAQEDCQELMKSVFADDHQARSVFEKHVEGHQAAEILITLKLTEQAYKTIMKRIRRKVSTFVSHSNQHRNLS